MNAELRKRLEEAVSRYIKETIPDDIPCYDSVVETTKQDFIAGAEWMFGAYMNKLLEEKK